MSVYGSSPNFSFVLSLGTAIPAFSQVSPSTKGNVVWNVLLINALSQCQQ